MNHPIFLQRKRHRRQMPERTNHDSARQSPDSHRDVSKPSHPISELGRVLQGCARQQKSKRKQGYQHQDTNTRYEDAPSSRSLPNYIFCGSTPQHVGNMCQKCTLTHFEPENRPCNGLKGEQRDHCVIVLVPFFARLVVPAKEDDPWNSNQENQREGDEDNHICRSPT